MTSRQSAFAALGAMIVSLQTSACGSSAEVPTQPMEDAGIDDAPGDAITDVPRDSAADGLDAFDAEDARTETTGDASDAGDAGEVAVDAGDDAIDAIDADGDDDADAGDDVADTAPPPLGHALRFGQTTHDGTVVKVTGTSISTTTDVDGAYWFTPPGGPGPFEMTFTNGAYEEKVTGVTFPGGVPSVAEDYGPSVRRLDPLALPRAHRFLDLATGSELLISPNRRWLALHHILDGVTSVDTVASPVGDGPAVTNTRADLPGREFSLDGRFFVLRTRDDGLSDRASAIVTLATGAVHEFTGFLSANVEPSSGPGIRGITKDGGRVVLARPVGSTGTRDVVTSTTDAAHVIKRLTSGASYVLGLTLDDRYVVYVSSGGTAVSVVAIDGGTATSAPCDRVMGIGVGFVLCIDGASPGSPGTLSSIAIPSGAKSAIATDVTWDSGGLSPGGTVVTFGKLAGTTLVMQSAVLRPGAAISFDVLPALAMVSPDEATLLYADTAHALRKWVSGSGVLVSPSFGDFVAFTPDSKRVVFNTASGDLQTLALGSSAAPATLLSGCDPAATALRPAASFSSDGTKILLSCTGDLYLGLSDGSAPSKLVHSTGFSSRVEDALAPDGSKFVLDGTVYDAAGAATPILWDGSVYSWDPEHAGSHWLDSATALFVDCSPASYRFEFQGGAYVATGL